MAADTHTWKSSLWTTNGLELAAAELPNELVANTDAVSHDNCGALGNVQVNPVVTQVLPAPAYFRAEDYHQDYATLHPTEPYIMMYDAPKVRALADHFKDLYKR